MTSTEVDTDFVKGCEVHRNLPRTQYCKTCKTLMCMVCRELHTKAESHSLIPLETIGIRVRERLQKAIDEAAVDEGIQNRKNKLKKKLLEDSEQTLLAKKVLKETMCNFIERVFQHALEEKINEIGLNVEELNIDNSKVKELEEIKDSIVSLIYEEKEYKKVCDLYEKPTEAEVETGNYIKSTDTLKGNLEKVSTAKVLEEIKERFAVNLNFLAQCAECKKDIIGEFLRKGKKLSLRYCVECSRIKTIVWANTSTRTFTGTASQWTTFCTNQMMPDYFECRIKLTNNNYLHGSYKSIGVSGNRCNASGGFYNLAENWWAIRDNSYLYGKNYTSKDKAKVSFGNNGDIVTIIYDRTKSLHFEVNDIDTGLSVGGVEGPFFVACADFTGTQYEIVEIIRL